MKKQLFSLILLILFSSIGFVSTSNAANEFYLSSGVTFTNTLQSSNDEHLYRIDTKQDGDIYAYISNTSAPMSIELYDYTKKERIGYSLSNYSVISGTVKAGTYYLKVEEYGWGNSYSSSSYDLIATYPSGSANHDSITFESNDTPENAYPIQSNVPIVSEISNEYDKDYYSLTLIKDGNVNISIPNTSAPLYLTLYDSKKERIGYVNSNSTLSVTLKAGTYYIEVEEYGWGYQYSSGKYILTANYPSGYFTDVTSTYPYYNEIYQVRDLGIINGYNDGTFKPNNSVSRQHIAAMIIRSGVKLDSIRNSTIFADVGYKHSYYNEINTLYRAGILDGSTKNNKRYFEPNSNVTRAQIAKILVNAYKLKGDESSSYYSDVKSKDWYYSYANILASNGIVLDNSKQFKANQKVTRGELAYMIKKVIDVSQ